MGTLPKTYTGPGLVDIQVNGYGGFNFNGPVEQYSSEALHDVRARLMRRGVRAAYPTLTTSDHEQMVRRAKRYAELIESDKDLAVIFPRMHIEGPLISSEDGPRGAHDLRWTISPAQKPDLIDRLNDACGGRIAIVTIAPELDGAIEMIRKYSARGICMSIGHTGANAAQIAAAVEAGATFCTHLGNGSHQMIHRLDNYIQSQLADDRLYASFIGDGHHMPLTTLKNFIRAKTVSRSVLTTDAMLAAELGPGMYDGIEVTPSGRAAVPGAPNCAGSVLTMDKAVINTCLHCDVSFEQAWMMASVNPCRFTNLPLTPNVTVEVTEKGFLCR